MTSISNAAFYNPVSSIALGTWYEQARTNSRQRAKSLRLVSLEQDSRKQEVVCSVILTLCLIFGLASCFVQLALS